MKIPFNSLTNKALIKKLIKNLRGKNLALAIAGTIILIIVLFIFTGRIFMELFQWLLLPLPAKLKLKSNRDKTN